MRLVREMAFVLIAASSSIASIQAASAREARRSHADAQFGWRNDYQAPARSLHQDGNSCAPDRAEPVWGAGNALLGYSCEPPSAN